MPLKQGRQITALFTLPEEILEEIVQELDQHKDLVAFALAAKSCAAAVIPHHTQYRILRVRHPLPEMWAHLARRSDLARKIREIHICERSDRSAPDHYPSSLIDGVLDLALHSSEESRRIHNICLALGHMHRLRVFSWSCKDAPGQQRPTSHPLHENAILTAVVHLPMLESLSLNGRFALHVLHSSLDPKSLTYPVWRVANLKSLTLSGEAWAKVGNSKHLCAVLSKSPNLEYLELPLEFQHLADCHLPKLKKLKLHIQVGATMGIDHSCALFLRNHPSIEELNWSPLGDVQIPFDSLPNLKSVTSNRPFILSLNTPNHLISPSSFAGPSSPPLSLTGFLTPPSTPTLANTPSCDSLPTSGEALPQIRRPVESLNILSLNTQMLLELECLDRTKLRKVKLYLFDLDALREVAEAFPNIEWLDLPVVHLSKDALYPSAVSKEQWLDILPRFRNLQTFRGQGLWNSVKGDPHSMHQVIIELVHSCPKLQELDHSEFYSKYLAYKRIIIKRHGQGTGEVNAGYDVVKPEPKQSLDVMNGAFD